MQETWVWSLGRENSLEKDTAGHSSVLAWAVSWTEELGGLQSIGLWRYGHDWGYMLLQIGNFSISLSIFSIWEQDLSPIPNFLFFFNLWWILSYIEMKQPWVCLCSPSWSPLPPSPIWWLFKSTGSQGKDTSMVKVPVQTGERPWRFSYAERDEQEWLSETSVLDFSLCLIYSANQDRGGLFYTDLNDMQISCISL